MNYPYLFALLLLAHPICATAETALSIQTNQENFQEQLYDLTQQQEIDSNFTEDNELPKDNSDTPLNDLNGLDNVDALFADITEKIESMNLDPKFLKQILEPSLSKQIAMRYLSELLKEQPILNLKNNITNNLVIFQSGFMRAFREGSTFIIETIIAADYNEINNPKKTALEEEKNLLRFKILKTRKQNEDPNSLSDLTKLDNNTKCYVQLFPKPSVQCQTFLSKKEFKAIIEEIQERNAPISIPQGEILEEDIYNSIHE